MAEAIFDRAPLAVMQVVEFGQLKNALERMFAAGAVEKFLGKLQGSGLRVRDWQGVLDKGLVEKLDAELKRLGRTAKAIYAALPESDQGLMREYYLEQLELVAGALRLKFSKVYRYY